MALKDAFQMGWYLGMTQEEEENHKRDEQRQHMNCQRNGSGKCTVE